MWLPDWTSQPPIPLFTLFAAQAWQELLSPQTPDTFQARVLDLPTLLQELAEVAALSGEEERWAAYLPMIGAELQDARQAEASYLARDARLRAAIEAITANIDVDSKTPRIVRERAHIALALFGPVEQRWKEHAQELANSGTQEKSLLLHRLSTLATHVLARGLEEESLTTISADACQAAPATFIEIVTACLSDRQESLTVSPPWMDNAATLPHSSGDHGSVRSAGVAVFAMTPFHATGANRTMVVSSSPFVFAPVRLVWPLSDACKSFQPC